MALAGGVAVFLIRLSRRQVPDQAIQVLGAAASFAALSTVFGSPIIGAVIVLEAAGLAGATMTVVMLPGLVAAGVGSLVFVGIGSLTGLSTESYAMPPLHLPAYGAPTIVDFLWTIPFALAAAIVVFAVFGVARLTKRVVTQRPFLLFPAAALLVGAVAIVFERVSGESAAGRAVLGRTRDGRRRRASGQRVPRRAHLAGRLQSRGVGDLHGCRPRRPDVPGDLPRPGRRRHGLAHPERRAVARHRRTRRRRRGLGAQTSVGLDRAGRADDPGRRRSDSPHHPRRRRRLHRDARVVPTCATRRADGPAGHATTPDGPSRTHSDGS